MKKFIIIFLCGISIIINDLVIKEKTSQIDVLNRIERCNIELIDNEYKTNLYIESIFNYYDIKITFLTDTRYKLSSKYYSYINNIEKEVVIIYLDGVKEESIGI